MSLKIASLVLAFFVWMYLRTEETGLGAFSVPLEIEGVPPELALGGEVLDAVGVRVRAPEATLQTLSPGRFSARVRLSNPRPGELELPLTPEMVRAPIGVEVVRVEPASLKLRLEPMISREVPVVARFRGEPASGYERGGQQVSPDKVIVLGPESEVRQVREAVTEEVDIGGRSSSFEAPVMVSADRSGARVAGVQTAMVRVDIRERRVTRTYAGVPVTPSVPAGRSYQAVYEPQTVTVVLEGTRAALDRVGPDNIRAVLDLEGMSPREAAYSVRPRITILPEDRGSGISVQTVDEPTISVKIRG